MLNSIVKKHKGKKLGHIRIWPILIILLLVFSSCEKDERFEGEINFDVVINKDESGKMKSLAPEKYHFKIKKNRIIFTTEGGLSSTLFGGMIFDGQKDEGYMLMKSSQLAYKMARGKDSKLAQKASEVTTEVKTTNEKAEILGYSVEKYIVTSTEGEKTTINEVWVTKDINIDFPKSLIESTPDMFFGAFEGFPLKVITISQSGREIAVIASEVNETSISSSAFEVPENYKVTEDDPSDMINMFRQFLK